MYSHTAYYLYQNVANFFLKDQMATILSSVVITVFSTNTVLNSVGNQSQTMLKGLKWPGSCETLFTETSHGPDLAFGLIACRSIPDESDHTIWLCPWRWSHTPLSPAPCLFCSRKLVQDSKSCKYPGKNPLAWTSDCSAAHQMKSDDTFIFKSLQNSFPKTLPSPYPLMWKYHISSFCTARFIKHSPNFSKYSNMALPMVKGVITWVW